MKISKIKIKGMTEPMGFAFDDLRCAWTVSGTMMNPFYPGQATGELGSGRKSSAALRKS